MQPETIKPTTDSQFTQAPEPLPVLQPKPPKKAKLSHFLNWFLILLLLAVVGGGAYFWRDDKAKTQHKTDQQAIAQLQAKVATLEKEAKTPAAAEKTTANAEVAKKLDVTAATANAVAPAATVADSIKDSIKSGNTAALEGYMASTVKFIIADTEGIGDQTPAEAIADLENLDTAVDPWDFNLSATTLKTYDEGDYGDYFTPTSIVGRSSDGYVVSFSFNSAGKISVVFVAVDDTVLQ